MNSVTWRTLALRCPYCGLCAAREVAVRPGACIWVFCGAVGCWAPWCAWCVPSCGLSGRELGLLACLGGPGPGRLAVAA